MDVENELMTLNEFKDEKQKRKSRRNRNKENAEFQFDVTAKPVKLEVFFKDMLEVQPDLPDDDAELTGHEEVAPMTFQPNLYPPNSESLAVEVLEAANNVLEINENEELSLNTNTTELINDINKQMVKIKTVSLTTGVDAESLEIRHQGPTLTAKRFSVKALQLFSFNENYRKHFTFDPKKLRELNTDMLIDQSLESAKWLNYIGEVYQKIYLRMVYDDNPSLTLRSDEDILNTLAPDNKFFRALGFSTILKHVTVKDLENFHNPLNMLAPFYDGTHYRLISVNHILHYFGMKVFGHDPMLNFQLNYLHLIPYYLKENKKSRIFEIFKSLDLNSKTNEI
jgi:hypothetical protein